MTNSPTIEQRLFIIDSKGHSQLVAGDPDAKKTTVSSKDGLSAHLSMGWLVISVTPYANTDSLLLLLQRETPAR